MVLRAVVALAAPACVAQPATPAQESQEGVGLERGVAVVTCADSSGFYSYSRAAVIDAVRSASGEVLLTAAHGLPRAVDAIRRDCLVHGFGGNRYEVADVWKPADSMPATERDWAVLLTARPIGGRITRWHVSALTGTEVASLVREQMAVRLLYRYRPVEQGDCRLLRGISQDTRPVWLLMSYSCQGQPGLSGSPVIAAVNGIPVLIGIHLGWRVESPGGRVSFARFVDDTIRQALRDALERAERPPVIEALQR